MTTRQKREEIKRLLALLTDHNRHIFKKMYSPSTDRDIDHVVDAMPARQLDWALQQVKNTYYGLFNKIKNTQ